MATNHQRKDADADGAGGRSIDNNIDYVRRYVSGTPVEVKQAIGIVLTPGTLPEGYSTQVRGYDFSDADSGKPVDYHALLQSFRTTGFQATNFGKAVEEITRMLEARGQPISEEMRKPFMEEPEDRPITNCTIFLGYTSNMISCGVRETIRYLVKNAMVDVLVTTAGGIEEDFIKCLAPTFLGEFALDGKHLRQQGINRTGNLLVPNSNYEKFEKWFVPLLDEMLKEQKTKGTIWSPSKMIARMGRAIDNPESVYYWAHKNNIPVFCPAITDGAIGDVIYMHGYRDPGLIVDVAQDITRIINLSLRSLHSGMIILGGGVIKHHICNTNLWRNGANFSVFVNTAHEFDGSDAGARPDEAVSWGKIKMDAQPVKVYGEATLVFPLLVAETFARVYREPPKPLPIAAARARAMDASEES